MDAAVFMTLLSAGASAAQAVVPSLPNGSARLERVVAAVNGAGYSHAVVVGHGAGTADGFFVLSATHGDSGVLVATVELGNASAPPVVLERGRTPADIGVREIEVTQFFGVRDLVDIVVSHQPLVLETTRTFATHHIVQATGAALTLKCDVDGSAMSSSSKGIGSMMSGRSVTMEAVPGQPMSFMVTVVEKTMRQQDREPATTSDSTVVTRRYEMQPTGTCRVLKLE